MPDLHEAWQGTFESWQRPRFGQIYARGTGRRVVTVGELQLFVSRRPLIGNVTLYLYAPRSDGEWVDDVLALARRLGATRLWAYSPNALEMLTPHLVDEPKTLLVDLNGGEAALWDSVGSKTRNMIRRAEKRGVSVRLAEGEPEISQWWEIYAKVAQAAGFAAHEEGLVRELLAAEDLARLFVSEYDGRVIGGGLFLTNRYPMYWLGGVDREHGTLAPGHILLWRAITHFADRGFFLLDLGGIDPEEEGSTRFKKSFSRDQIGAHVYDVPIAGWKRTVLSRLLR